LDDLAFEIVDQVAEGDRVATRFFVNGSNCGRRVRLEGNTLSRLRDSRIGRGLVGIRQLRAPQAARIASQPGCRAAHAAGGSRRARELVWSLRPTGAG
jgi:hypothetical protein